MNFRMLVDAVRAHFEARTAVSEIEMRFAERFRQFAKWWFDLVKNAIVVVALKVLADKSQLWYINVLYQFSKYILIFYCIAYFQGYYYVPFGSQTGGIIRFITFVITAVLVWLLILWSISASAVLIIEALSKLQTHQ